MESARAGMVMPSVQQPANNAARAARMDDEFMPSTQGLQNGAG
jgi:hypothetical protein